MPLTGYTLENSDVIIGNEVAKTVTWDGKKDLSDLISKPVRLHIYMKDADLFSIRFK